MIHYDVPAHSVEWEQLRLGCIGSSEFSKVVTPKLLKPAESRYPLMYQKLAEWITGAKLPNQFESPWMRRGIEEEDAGILAYENYTGVKTKPTTTPKPKSPMEYLF